MPDHQTTDAVEILHRRYVRRPDRLAQLERARLHTEIAQQVYDLRTSRGLTQKELADRVGTKASAICRLEDADYGAHSLTMLERIAGALGAQIRVSFEACGERGRVPHIETVPLADITASTSFRESYSRRLSEILSTLPHRDGLIGVYQTQASPQFCRRGPEASSQHLAESLAV